MKLTDILTSDCTICAAPSISKKSVLEQICKIASSQISEISEKELLTSLTNREKISSTGIGNGIAIPHGRLGSTNQVVAVLLTTQKAVAFDAIDDKPVDIFFALFVPEAHCQQHLETLTNIAKLLSEKETCKKIRRCFSSSELYQLVINNAL